MKGALISVPQLQIICYGVVGENAFGSGSAVTVHGESFVAGFCVLAETSCGKWRENQIASYFGQK